MDESLKLPYFLAQINASAARIEGMKVSNRMREEQGQSPAYGEEAFVWESNFLMGLAEDILNQ